jgi:CRISPR-associated endonuclease/helicase Cas3
MTVRQLRAKSWDDGKAGPPPTGIFLSQHLADVYSSAKRVLESTADDQLLAFGLQPEQHRARFQRCVLLAAALHDLGKANSHFQGMIYGRRDVRVQPQGLRHEWVTLLMLQELRDWLLPALEHSRRDFSFVEWAVVGHHPSREHASPPRSCPPGAGAEIEFLMGEADFKTALDFLRSVFQLEESPATVNYARNLVGSRNVFEELAQWSRANQKMWDQLRSESRIWGINLSRGGSMDNGSNSVGLAPPVTAPDWRLVAAVKNCLIAADIAGSALPKGYAGNPDWSDWITQSFATRPEPGDLRSIVDHRLGNNIIRPFQQEVALSSDAVTLVKAGCGSGKTLAAYMWAVTNHPSRRLYFCYPTTGTATEGFRDYLYDEVEGNSRVGARLFHSRRDVDLDIILNAGQDLITPTDEVTKHVEAIESWSTPIVTCTADTVLGLMQNNRRGLLAWPALAQAAVVFDEIHAFDNRLFGTLLRFLRDLPGVPVLLMTASLPSVRENALRAVVEGRGQRLLPVPGPPELENLPRYHREVPGSHDPIPEIRRILERQGKVLWVCNTVNRVMEAATFAAEHCPILYHSRFKYEDRVARHKAVVDAFNPQINAGSAFAICSQVAEMSLDLSADLLVTDLAPVPALIQRLGRLNRRVRPGGPTKPFIVVDPEHHLPYTPVQLEAARQWLARLPTTDISQHALAEVWEQTDDPTPVSTPSAWLDGGPVTTVSELRESSVGITVLLDTDRIAVRNDSSLLRRLILPMPAPSTLSWQAWPRERGIPVAPGDSILYDRMRGAEWQKKT